MRIISHLEFESVSALDPPKRYSHLIKRVADEEVIWGLWGDGWAVAADDAGKEMIPVWPHPRYAEACATGSWSGYAPKSISLDDWLHKWLGAVLIRGSRNRS